MQRALYIILTLFIIFSFCPDKVFAEVEIIEPDKINAEKTSVEENSLGEDPILPSIFIWQTPDEEISETDDNDEIYGYDDRNLPDETYGYVDDLYVANYDNVKLKGYLDYIDGSDAIGLKKTDNTMVLNLRVPQKFNSHKIYKNSFKLPNTTFSQNIYGRNSDLAYNITPLDFDTELKHGGFSVGTSYNESIDYSDLGFNTSFYTKYENKYFSLKTSYDKNSGVAYADIIDKFSFSPELKLNKYISIKDVITSDITRNRRKNEIILSIKPSNDDKVRFEFGAGQTYDENSVLLRSQVKFSTQYKW